MEVEARVAPAFPTPSKIRVRIHMFLFGSRFTAVECQGNWTSEVRGYSDTCLN